MESTTNNNKVKTTALALSATALITLAVNEGYSDHAYIPVKGDVPTIGFGETRGVKMGDRTTPIDALKTLQKGLEPYEAGVRSCVHVPISQNEFDAYVDFTYNVGTTAFCSSTLVRLLNAKHYDEACHELLKWNKFQGKTLPGLTKRREEEYKTCIGESQ